MKQSIFFLFLAVNFISYSQVTDISEGNDFDGEPFIAINPDQPEHIVVAWMSLNGFNLIQIATRVSFDGGNTWSEKYHIPHVTPGFTCADPSLAFDHEGNVFVCYIDYDPFATAGGVYIRKSTDGGLTWNDPVQAIDLFADGFEMPVDRPWMVIDKSGGPLSGAIYITTKPAPWIPAPNKNYLVVSLNGGLGFEDWKSIDTDGFNIGPFIQAPMASPAVSSSGILHCVYPAFDLTENLLPRFIHASTEDAGENFVYHEMIESFGEDLMTDTLPKLGYLLICDPSDENHLAFNFILKLYGDADIFILESFDAGVSWSDPIRVNDDVQGNGIMQDMVWADFNEDGDLAVCWRDRRNAADTGYAVASEFAYAVKYRDSASFSQNKKLSNELVAFNDILKENGNDFMGCEFIGDTLFGVWGAVREETLNIWFSKLSITTGDELQLVNLNSDVQTIIVNPNPFNGIVRFSRPDFENIKIYDETGNMVFESEMNLQSIDLGYLEPGIYILRASAGSLWYEQTIIRQ